MRFDVVTLFPELFGPHLENGITRRAFSVYFSNISTVYYFCRRNCPTNSASMPEA